MRVLYFIICLFIFTQTSAQTGVSDMSFGTGGAKKLIIENRPQSSGELDYDIKKIAFTTDGLAVLFKNDLNADNVAMSVSIANEMLDNIKVWDFITRANDGIVTATNHVYFTGYTAKDDGNKAMYVVKLKRTSTTMWWTPDTNFGADSKVVFDTKEHNEEATSIKEKNGKVVITGFSGNDGIVVRYNADGTLDRSFNINGFYRFTIGQNTKPTAVSIQADNKIVIAGNCSNGSNIDFFVTRFNENGTIDTGFGTNGVVIQDHNNRENTGNAMQVLADGSIYIAGKASTTGTVWMNIAPNFTSDASVFKYNASGQLDTSFTNGVIPGAIIYCSGYNLPNNVTVGEDEEILDFTYDSVNNRFMGFGYSVNYLSGKKVSKATTIFITGTAPGISLNGVGSTAIENYVTTGAIKPSDIVLGSTPVTYQIVRFESCTGGQTNRFKIPTYAYPSTCANSSGWLYISDLQETTSSYFAIDNSDRLWRLDANHNVDMSFGVNGRINNIDKFTIDGDGKIVCRLMPIAGAGIGQLLVRYNPDGSLDQTFGTFGAVTAISLSEVASITVTPQNDYIVTKRSQIGTSYLPAIEKIKNSGNRDLSFGTNGVTTLATATHEVAKNLPKDAPGNYYSLIYKNSPSDVTSQSAKLIKLMPNGQPDPAFGVGGTVDLMAFMTLATVTSSPVDFIRTDSGKFLVFMYKKMVQLNADGSLDTNFGTNGVVTFTSVLPDYSIFDVVANGSDYFVGGYSFSGSDKSTVIKVNSSGTIDTSFGTNGIYVDSNADPLFIAHGFSSMYFDGPSSLIFYAGAVLKKLN
jgi:uncharacterized delta-60 repeat protein